LYLDRVAEFPRDAIAGGARNDFDGESCHVD
jgi:hypothetical protein